MDSEPYTQKNTGNEQKKIIHNVPDGRNVLQSIWIRRNSITTDQINRILWESELGFVFPCGILLWTLFLIFG